MDLSQGVFALEQQLQQSQAYIALLRKRLQYFCERTGDYGRHDEHGAFIGFLDSVPMKLEEPKNERVEFQRELDNLTNKYNEHVALLEKQNQDLRNELAQNEALDQQRWLDLERQLVDARAKLADYESVSTSMTHMEEKVEQYKLAHKDMQQTYDLQETMLVQATGKLEDQDKELKILRGTLKAMVQQRADALEETEKIKKLLKNVQTGRDDLQRQMAANVNQYRHKDQQCQELLKVLKRVRKEKANLGKVLSVIRTHIESASVPA